MAIKTNMVNLEPSGSVNKVGVNNSGMSSDMVGTYHYKDFDLFEPQRRNNFELIITGLDDLYQLGKATNGERSTFTDASEVLRLTVKSAKIPHFTQDAIKLKRGNNEIKYAGVPTFQSGSLTVYDTIGPDSKGVLMAWQNLCYDVQTEKVGLAGDYKRDAYLCEYTPDWQMVRAWKLYGCWISGLSEDDMDWESGSGKNVTVTLEYDKAAIVDMSDYNTITIY